jgi:hypothetical protein
MFIDDVIFLLTEAGLGAYGTSIFKGTKPVIPLGAGPFTSVARTGGQGDAGTHNLSRITIAYERPSAQILVRAEVYEDAQTAIEIAYDALNFYDRFVNGTWWMRCSPKQEPFELPVDENGRARFAFNIDSEKRLSPATS